MAWRRKKELPVMSSISASQVNPIETQLIQNQIPQQQPTYSNILPVNPPSSSWGLQEVMINQNRFRVFVNQQTGESLDLYEAILHILNSI